jgi:hypothetical protein
LLDQDAIRRSAMQNKSSHGYQPSRIKNEARKLRTQERNNEIYKQYKKIKKLSPNKSNTEIAKEIFKLEIAPGKEPSTILRIINKFKNN